MSDVCGNQPICGFFKKYAGSDHEACTGSIKTYCQGPRRGACEREVYRKTHKTAPPDDLLPTGLLIA